MISLIFSEILCLWTILVQNSRWDFKMELILSVYRLRFFTHNNTYQRISKYHINNNQVSVWQYVFDNKQARIVHAECMKLQVKYTYAPINRIAKIKIQK